MKYDDLYLLFIGKMPVRQFWEKPWQGNDFNLTSKWNVLCTQHVNIVVPSRKSHINRFAAERFRELLFSQQM